MNFEGLTITDLYSIHKYLLQKLVNVPSESAEYDKIYKQDDAIEAEIDRRLRERGIIE